MTQTPPSPTATAVGNSATPSVVDTSTSTVAGATVAGVAGVGGRGRQAMSPATPNPGASASIRTSLPSGRMT